MSTGTERGTEGRLDTTELQVGLPSPATRTRDLPGWAPWAILAGVVVVVGGGALALGAGVGLAVVAVAVLFALAVYLTSRFVEGARRATDRLVTVIVSTAFLIAMAPLVSVIITVLANGLARFDAQFFTYSMRGVIGEGGGGSSPSSSTS
jgi:phosphate transport system permease protein